MKAFPLYLWHFCKYMSWKDSNEHVSHQYAARLHTLCWMSCPVAPQWVSGCLWEADWLASPDEGHVPPHLGTGGLTGWLHHMINGMIATADCVAWTRTLINLLRGLKSEGLHFTLSKSYLDEGLTIKQADRWMLRSSRKHFCQCVNIQCCDGD